MSKYNTLYNYPMLLGECGHTLCLACSTNLKQCPICFGSVFEKLVKNTALVEETPKVISDAKVEEIKKESVKEVKEYTKEVRCPNGHKAKWLGEEYKCAACKGLAYGWHCLECKYLKCDNCAKTVFPQGRCPNGHKAIWKGEISLNSRDYKIGRPDYLIETGSSTSKHPSSYRQ